MSHDAESPQWGNRDPADKALNAAPDQRKESVDNAQWIASCSYAIAVCHYCVPNEETTG